MFTLSSLVIAVLAQVVPNQVEVRGGGSTFWYDTAHRAWEQVRGDVQLDARRTNEGAARARLMMSVIHEDALWTVELEQSRPDEMFVDADVDGPGGKVHATVALRASAKVTRNGVVVTRSGRLQAFALTTGFHADDGTFQMLPQPRTGHLELLVHLQDVPGEEFVDIGFDSPEILVDGTPMAPERTMTSALGDESFASGTGGRAVPSEPAQSSLEPRVVPTALTRSVASADVAAVADRPVIDSSWNVVGAAQPVSPPTLPVPPPPIGPAWSGGCAQPAPPPIAAVAPPPISPAWSGGGAQSAPRPIAPVPPGTDAAIDPRSAMPLPAGAPSGGPGPSLPSAHDTRTSNEPIDFDRPPRGAER